MAQGTCQYGKVHKETVTGTTKRVTTEGNCQTKEKYVYVATFKAEWAKEQTSETFTGEKNMANHTSTEYIYVDNKDGTHTKKHACCPTEVEKGEHTWDDGVVAPDSTCLGAGVKTYTCTADGCDATYTEAVNAKGHTFGEITPAKAATCQAPGNDAYKQCTACNRYFAADAAADAANGAATAEGFVKSQLEHSYIGAYINKENGTHSQKCVNGCDQYGEPVDHTYSTDDHTCACGAVKSYPVHFYLNRDDEEPAYVAMVPYGTQFIVDWEETDALKALVNEANSALGETPSKEHYTFGGWYGFYDYQTMPAETAKIYVYWEAIQYNVTWDLAGGSFKTYWISPDTTASYNGTIGVVTDPDHSEIFVEREGYTFSHFVDQKGNVYTPVLKAVGSDMYQWDVGVMPGHDITLTAVWTINKYTLTIQYGKAIDGECNWVKEELSVPYGTKLIDLEFIKNLPASFETNCSDEVGKWTLSGTYAFGEPEGTLSSVDIPEELTMPAHDAYLDVEYWFTGWCNFGDGWTYEIDNDIQKTGWTEIDGAWYYLDPTTGIRAEGAKRVPYPSVEINGITYGPNADDYASWEANKENSKYTDATNAVFVFGADGKFQQTTGILDGRYAKDGMIGWHPGMVNVNGENYYFIADVSGGGNIAANGDTNVTRGFEKKGTYNFVNGKFSGANGIKDGKYYENSKLMKGNGLTKVGNEYIYVRSNGYIVVNAEYYVPANEYKIVPGMYTFNENGYLVNPEYTTKNGIVEENGDMFYYKDGKRFYAGLIKDGNDMYYVRSNGQIATGTYYVTKTNEDVTGIAPGTKLIFGADGKMQAIKNGIVEENGVKYYYKDNKLFYAGLIKDGNDMYYVRSNGQIATGTYYVTKSNKDTTGIAPGTKLVFGADGKLLPAMNGIVEENGAKYYYENGKLMKGAGVVKLTDENGVTFYIYVRSNGQLATGTYWPTIRNGYLKSGKYDWGTNGRYYPAG